MKERIAALAWLGLALIPMTTNATSSITAQIFRMPEYVEPAAVTTAGHYILASQLLRSLTKLDKFGKIQGDIARKWTLAPDRKSWTIELGAAQFSDGTPITATDVANTIARQKKLGAGVHFPFAQIEAVAVTSPAELRITLANPRNDFIYDLSKPEFGVLSPQDAAAAKEKAAYSITSGPYSLVSRAGPSFHLRRNPYFKGDVHNDLDLTIENADGASSPAALTAGKISFFTTQQNLSEERHAEVARSPNLRAVKPHIAFSYWLSLNPDSPYFAVPAHRASFQAYVRAFRSREMDGFSWEKADQLYLPDGEGRPTADQLAATWRSVKKNARPLVGKKPHLRVIPLTVSSTLLDELLAYLGQRFEVEMVPFTTEDQLVALIKAKKFDLKLSANDFSSIELSENLKTTFNATRPYIFLDRHSPVKGLLQRAVETSDKAVQAKIFQEIALILLKDGLIAPLAYQRIWFYYDRKLDLGEWSNLFPEISFWKVKVRPHGD